MLLAALLMLAESNAAATNAAPFAIACAGKITYSEKKPPRNVTRTYVIRKNDELVSFWNPDLGKEIPLCNKSSPRCHIVFYPYKILVDGEMHNHGEIDRQSGKVWELWPGADTFKGNCVPAPMPEADVTKNKF